MLIENVVIFNPPQSKVTAYENGTLNVPFFIRIYRQLGLF
ncbi:hypothetical protein A6A12_2822 [Vibrio anguillarum]|nr:hypothetical protein A6A12_2822 [Vibrio anguillarum]